MYTSSERIKQVKRIFSWCAAGLLAAGLAEAQQTFQPIKVGSAVFSGSIRSRLENWGWFEPASTAADSAYTFSGSTIRFGLSQTKKTFDWNLELEAPVLLHLPENSVAPGAAGQLGQGATYYVANGRSANAAMIFPKQAFVRFKPAGSPAFSLRLGRFEFQDGSEVAPKDPTVGLVKRERIQQRLLGPFVFTHVMRSFDGFHAVYNKPKINYTLMGAVPTRGVFQVDGWGWMKVAFAYGSATGQVQTKSTTGEWRAFSIYYDDWRHITKADNRPAAVRPADLANIRILTWGAHYVSATKTAAGTFDVMGEFALQNGKWGRQQHRAGMADVEGGFQPKLLPKLKPWLRAGYYYGSGDNDPNDNKHQTFFQILPTARPFARFPFFDMENNVDRFAMLTLRPHPRFTFKTEAHSLSLANGRDLWYAGGGAFQPWTFGYQSKAHSGSAALANLFDANVDVVVNPHVTVSPYIGYASGKTVIQSIYPRGKNGHLAYLELNYRF